MGKTVLNNGTKNQAFGKNSIAFGQGTRAYGDNQTALGRYNEITGDTSTDAMLFGAGTKSEPFTAMRIKADGEVETLGGEVYMQSPDTGEYIPVYMVGRENKLKKVYLSR